MRSHPSYDVFDTVVTRLVGAPTSLHILVGFALQRLGVVHCSPNEYAASRVAAEKAARLQRDGSEETDFAAIHNALQWHLGLTAEQSSTVRELELELERRLVVAVPGMREELRQARSVSQQVRFLSDMYLPQAVVYDLLHRCDLIEVGDSLYVSSDCGLTKRTGRLFEHVCRENNLETGALVHHGDHRNIGF